MTGRRPVGELDADQGLGDLEVPTNQLRRLTHADDPMAGPRWHDTATPVVEHLDGDAIGGVRDRPSASASQPACLSTLMSAS